MEDNKCSNYRYAEARFLMNLIEKHLIYRYRNKRSLNVLRIHLSTRFNLKTLYDMSQSNGFGPAETVAFSRKSVRAKSTYQTVLPEIRFLYVSGRRQLVYKPLIRLTRIRHA